MSGRSVRGLLRLAVWVLALLSAACSRGELKLATFRCDVTPPLGGHPLIWLTPAKTVEDPLWAKGVVLDDGHERHRVVRRRLVRAVQLVAPVVPREDRRGRRH